MSGHSTQKSSVGLREIVETALSQPSYAESYRMKSTVALRMKIRFAGTAEIGPLTAKIPITTPTESVFP